MTDEIDKPGLKRLEDGRIRVRATYKRPDGKRIDRQRTMPKGTTVAEAAQRRQELLAEMKGVDRTEEPSVPRLVSDYAVRWMTRKANEGLSPNTVREYRKTLEHKIIPQLGHIRLDDFDREDILNWIDWATSQTNRQGEVMATATVRGWWRVLRVMLRDAYGDGYLERDYTQRVPTIRTGRRDVRQYDVLTVDEAKLFLAVARQEVPDRFAELLTLAMTGMRSGELWALRWEDIDFGACVIRIHRSVSAGEIRESTKAGYDREVPIVDWHRDVLKEHHDREMRQQTRRYQLSDLAFPSNKGTPRLPGSLRKAADTVCEVAGIDKRVSPQSLRRQVSTLLEALGVPLALRQAIIGHASEDMSAHYRQLSDAEKRQVIDDLADALMG